MTGSPSASELRSIAVEVATATAAYLEVAVREVDTHDTKSSKTDLVTAYDREAERRIVEAIGARRPSDGFKGEEGTDVAGSTNVRWIIDPIDGTTNFVLGHPGFCVSIAAELDGVVVAGAVADPLHRQVFDAELGGGAYCNGTAISVRPTTDLGLAIVATGFSYPPALRTIEATALVSIIPHIADIRRMGSAAVDLCSVALGRVDAYYELDLNEWDLAAGALIASEAGAIVTLPNPDDDHGMVVAAAPGIAEDLAALLATSGLPPANATD